MIPAIQELNFPKIDGKQYATLSHATVNLADMGEKTISTQVKIDGDIVPDFSHDWEVAFQGEKYIMPLRLPQGAKENTSLNSTIDLTFQHWAIWQLKRWTFVTMQPIDTGTAVADEEVASVQLNLKDFCDLFGQVLRYYYGDTITIDLNPAWQYDNAPTAIEISHSYIWNVLIDAFHDKYGVRWAIEPREDNDNTIKGGERYVIKIGYPTTEVDHIFEYGFEGGLLKLERQVQSEEIHNMIKGRGGNTNIPFRYFKDTDPNNKDFAPDPDWVEELKNIYFTNLMPATYRSYIQGWKAAHISKYPGYKAVGENNAYSPWAYRKGFTDTKFHPVEFVADEITNNPQEGDRQVQIYPDYSPFVKKGSSIDVYGPLLAPLDNNDDIYPTIQGTGLDIAVDVEQIESDDVAESVENDAQLSGIKGATLTVKTNEMAKETIIVDFPEFTVLPGQTAVLEPGVYTKTAYHHVFGNKDRKIDITDRIVISSSPVITVKNAVTGEAHSGTGIPEGRWVWSAAFDVEVDYQSELGYYIYVTVGYESPKIESATIVDDKWTNTFNIWVKDIWGSKKLTGETDSQYSERVWKPILGDRDKNTAKVVFTSGMLLHEDYEFTIVDFPVPDTSKTYTDANGIRHDSYWRIKLAKSDAELEATGLYVPSTQKQGKAGDTFAFVGTEMTHVPYVVDAEIRLDDWKKDHLGEVKEIKPTFVVTTDRVRLNNEGKPDALINQLRVGNSLRIADKRFIQPMGDRAYETLYLQSLTYIYREPSSDDAALNPDVEIVLSNEYTTSANPVSVMQGEISSMQRLLGSISNVEQIVRAVGDKLYLRKDGISDISYSPTRFFSLLTSGNFRAGIVGGAGWGFFKDENGNWVLEADRVNVRQEMQVNTLVINQAEGRGGMEIDTAAYMEVTHVVDTTEGYVCYFDQKNGSVANLFRVDDVAYCNRWTPENQELKFYKRRVVAVGVDSITLSKTDVNGTGIPAEKDNIIHFGNYTDKTRQYVKVRDVVGGGYERYIENLDSVNAEGVEYYFVGKQAGESRWFVGNKDLVPYSGKGDGSYIEYINRRFNLNNVTLSINTTIGDQSLADYIQQVSPPVKQEDIEGFVDAIVDPKIEGIQNQIDGVIETWFYNGVPTLGNYPANGWNTDALKIQHLGDLYYDNNTGTAYRFSQNAQGGYYWNTITDDAITKALAAAKTAQDTADGKRRIFTSQPVPPYDEGDLWVNATYGTQYSNDILRCLKSRATGSFAISDWGLASNYTDDSALNAFISGYQQTIKDIETQIDGKAQTWRQPTDPSVTWTTAADKAMHKGDLWYCTADIAGTNFKKGTTWYWNGTAWEEQSIPDSVFDEIDGKSSIFVSKPTDGYKERDLWFLERDYTLGSPAVAYKAGTLVAAIRDMGAAWSAADWTKKDRYTDDTLAQQAKDAADNAKSEADAAKAAADAAQTSVSNLNTYVDGAFKDGVISEAEASGIANYINTVNSDKERIKGTYEKLYDNAYLTGNAKAALKTAYDNVMSRIDALITAINNAIADSKVTAEESAAVDSAFADFNSANGAFGVAVEAANNAIQDTLKSYADAALVAAENAQKAADNAKADAKDAKDRLDSWAADGVISPTEKQGIKDEIARIDADKAHITAEYARYGLGTPTAYNSDHAAYRKQLVELSAATPENITIPSSFAANQTAYYNQRTTALGVIADAAKKYADYVAKEEAKKAVAGYEYLKKAMADVTTIAGGLMLSSQIRLGEHNEDFTTQTTWSGMNGVYGNGRTIAAWYGGDMLDYFDANDNRLVFTQGKRPAASLIRMDGSAYFAKGNIGFRADGSGWLGNDLTGIKFSKDGGMTFGSGVTFDVTNVEGLKDSLDSLANFNIGLQQLLVPVGVDTEIDSTERELSWQRVGQTGVTVTSLKAKTGLWSTSFVSARGVGSGGSSGGSSGGGLDAAQLQEYLTQHGYATQTWVRTQGYATVTALAGKADKATTLEGYGITDAYTIAETQTYVSLALDDHYTKKETYSSPIVVYISRFVQLDFTDDLPQSSMGDTPTILYDTISKTLVASTGYPIWSVITSPSDIYPNWKDAKLVGSVLSTGKPVRGWVPRSDVLYYWDGFYRWDGNDMVKVDELGSGGGVSESFLADYLSEHKYVTEGWVESRGFLTQHQSIYSLVILKNGAVVGSYKPNEAGRTIDITDVASAATLSSHTGNTTMHITAAERTKWNKVVADFAAITGTDSDTVINKWEEVVAFLDTYTEADTLAKLLSNKVDKVSGKGLSTNDFTTAYKAKLDGIEAGANNYTLPTAAATVKGGVKVGVFGGLKMEGETLVVNLSSANIPSLDWSKITSGKPTTLAGYGITDAYTKTEADGRFQPKGSYLTAITKAQVEAVLTGNITSHTHVQYAPLILLANYLERVKLDNNTDIAAITGSHFYYSDTDGNSATLKNAPFAQSFMMLTQTCYNSGDDIRRARLAVDAFGGIKVFDDRSATGTAGTWHTVLTDKNAKISSGTITINGASITPLTTHQSIYPLTIVGGAFSIKSVYNPAKGAGTLAVPTHTSHLTNDSGFLTSHQSLANYVTLNTAQTITGVKTFSGEHKFVATGNTYSDPWANTVCAIKVTGKIGVTDSVRAASFVKSGGTSSQFLKADGSVDSHDYATNSDVADLLGNYVTESALDRYLTKENAELMFVTGLAVSGNQIAPVIYGVTGKAITVPYATNANGLANNPDMTYGVGRFQWFNLNATAGCTAKVNDAPTSAWWHILRLNHANNAGYYTDIAVPFNHDSLYWKCVRNGSLAHTSWIRILDTLNYASILDSRYYTEAEADAKYVTALGIAGDWLTWTKNGAVNNLTVHFATESRVLRSHGRLTAVSGAKHGSGVRLYEVYNNGYPTTYGNVLAVQGSTAAGAGELLMGWSGSDARHANLYYRNCRDNTTTWSAWATILDSVNFNSVIGSNLTAYVKESGDTMTGALTVENVFSVTAANGSITANLTSDNFFGPLIASNNAIRLGRDGARWANLYATTINVSSNALVSNLNADLWDGEHRSSFFMRKRYSINLASLSSSNFYPVTFGGNNREQLDCEIISPSATGSAAYNQNHIHFLLTANGWSDTAQRFVMLTGGNYDDNEITIGAVGAGARHGERCVWLRGGLNYTVIANHAPTLRTTDYTYGDEIYTVGTGLSGGTNAHVNICWQNNSSRNNQGVALIGSNVASATKLQTARSLWGQSFDGTGNVNGDMTGVGSISAIGIIRTDGELQVGNNGSKFRVTAAGVVSAASSVTAASFVKRGGTASQLLAANGSVREVLTYDDLSDNAIDVRNIDVTKADPVVTREALSGWDGSYKINSMVNGSVTEVRRSDLAYCDRGRFGDMATKSAADYVTVATEQTISGVKIFNDNRLRVRSANRMGLIFYSLSDSNTDRVAAIELLNSSGFWARNSIDFYKTGFVSFRNGAKCEGNFTATSLIKSGGTSSQVLMADGSVRNVFRTGYSTEAGVAIPTNNNDGAEDKIIDAFALQLWNGAYTTPATARVVDGSGVEIKSRLAYCKHGEFGDIVTHSASEFLTAHQSLANYMTLNTAQTVSGAKTFTGNTLAGQVGLRGQVYMYSTAYNSSYRTLIMAVGNGNTSDSTQNTYGIFSLWTLLKSNNNFGGSVTESAVALMAFDKNKNMIVGGYGHVAGSAKLHVVGGIYSTGNISGASITNRSDARLKDILGDTGLSFRDVAALPSVRFRWKASQERVNAGTVAQSVNRVLPEVVYKGGDGYLAVDYGALAHCEAVTVARGLVGVADEVELLKAEVKRLKARIEELESKE